MGIFQWKLNFLTVFLDLLNKKLPGLTARDMVHLQLQCICV